MALQNRAAATSTTSGTGALTLGAAPDGYAALTDGEQIPYLLAVSDGTWEVGYGTVSGTGTSFTRALPLEGTAVASLPAGTHLIYCVPLAQASLEASPDPAETIPAAGPTLFARGVAAGVSSYANADGVAVGYSAYAGPNSAAFGRSAYTGEFSVALGSQAVTADNGVAIGHKAACSDVYGIAIGPPGALGTEYVSAAADTINIGSIGSADPPTNTVIVGHARNVSSGQRIFSQKAQASQGRRVYQEGTVQTTDATPTAMPNIPLNGGSGTFELSVFGADGTNVYAVRIQGVFYNGALVGTPVSTTLISTLAGAVSLSSSAGNLVVTVTGVAATTVDWGFGIDQHAFTTP